MNSFLKRLSRWVVRAGEVAPEVLPVALAAFGAVAMLLLVVGRLDNWLVWPLGLLAAILAGWYTASIKRASLPGSDVERRRVNILALVLVLGWGLWNVVFTSQHIFTNRDPATYVSSAAWLVHHDSLKIETPQFFGADTSFRNDSPGFETHAADQGQVYAQGQHLLPVLMGLAGRVVGESAMLHAPILLAMVGLLAVYGFARLFMLPRWALLATAIISLTLPMLYFSRDMFTEPLTMAFLFAGMSLVWTAFQARERRAWLLAGLVVGAAAMTRIDVYISVAGIVAFAAVALAIMAGKTERKMFVRDVVAFLAIVGSLSVVALADMAELSRPYLAFHKHLLLQEVLGLVAVAVVGAAFVWFAWNRQLLRRLQQLQVRWRFVSLASVIIVVGLLLASRPLWFTGSTNQQVPSTASLQAHRGIPVEPRSYSEQSVDWVAWYVGAPLMLLGLAGLAMAAEDATKRGKTAMLLGVAVVSITGLVYFVEPSVAPDQIWASRRYLPIVLPGVVIFGMLPVAFLWRKYAKDWPSRRLAAAVLVAVLLSAPLFSSKPFLRHRDVTQLEAITGVCQKLPQKSAVIWVGDGQYYLLQPTRSFCGVPAFAYVPTTLDWKAIGHAAEQLRAAGYTPVVATMTGDLPLLGAQAERLTDASTIVEREMEMRLLGPPKNAETKTFSVKIGIIQKDATIAPVR